MSDPNRYVIAVVPAELDRSLYFGPGRSLYFGPDRHHPPTEWKRPCKCMDYDDGPYKHGPCDGSGTITTPLPSIIDWEGQRLAVEAVPIVRGPCPDLTNAKHRRAHIHLSEPSDDTTAAGFCHENADLVWDNPWKSDNAITLPDHAKPGDYAIVARRHHDPHRWVSSGHPEDDCPWCADCGLPIDEPGWNKPCPKPRHSP